MASDVNGKRAPSQVPSSPKTSGRASAPPSQLSQRPTRNQINKDEMKPYTGGNSKVKDFDTASRFLAGRTGLELNDNYFLRDLAMSLFQLTQLGSTLPTYAADGMRAVGFILLSAHEAKVEVQNTEVCFKAALGVVKEAASSVIATSTKTIAETAQLQVTAGKDALAPTIERLESHSAAIEMVLDKQNEIAERMQTISSSIDAANLIMATTESRITASASKLTPAADKIVSTINNAVSASPASSLTTDFPSATQQGRPATYASVTAAAALATSHVLPASHSRLVAKQEEQRLQVLIGRDSRQPDGLFKDYDEEAILATFTNVIDVLNDRKLLPAAPSGPLIRGVRRLARSGDICLEMESIEAAEWLSADKVMELVLQELGNAAVAKRRHYQVVAEFLPVNVNIEKGETLRTIEHDSRLPDNCIKGIRWIKPLERRGPRQQTALAIITFNSADAANHAIRHSLYVAKRPIRTRKLLHEPNKCHRCQKVNVEHISHNCKHPTDVCARCAGDHRTKECSVTDPAQYRCANCKGEGHGSWDKSCPVYEDAVRKVNAQTPANFYKFFVTSDPATWVLLDQPPPITHSNHDSPGTMPPPPIPPRGRAANTQHDGRTNKNQSRGGKSRSVARRGQLTGANAAEPFADATNRHRSQSRPQSRLGLSQLRLDTFLKASEPDAVGPSQASSSQPAAVPGQSPRG